MSVIARQRKPIFTVSACTSLRCVALKDCPTLRKSGVVDYVMKISAPDADLARMLVSDLVETDPRLQLNEDTVELIERNSERLSLAETEFVVFDLETA